VELAYRFGRASWGRGYATEAAGACLRYGFERLGLERIIAITAPDHLASRRVMEKNGLTLVGMASFYGRELVQYAIERPGNSSPPPARLSITTERGRTHAAPAVRPSPSPGEGSERGAGGEGISPEQAAFLERQRSGRLATVDPRGQPHAVPICYALLDGILYTPIDEKPKTGDPRELRRIRNILENPKVCLVVDHYEDEDWSRLAWLQVRGVASLVEDEAERERALAALRGRYVQYRSMALEGLPLLRITPTRLVGWSGELKAPGVGR
jgi:PPOX class probable F420-dependent enzyme